MTRENYLYGGAYAMVLLHEQKMRSFVNIWIQAARTNLILPRVDDADYASLETLLRHVLRASRGYMTWMCEKLELENPGIDPVPEIDEIAAQADAYLEHLLEKWRAPLCKVPEERFYRPAFTSRWDVDYCIDAMMEHAVMHPIRHEFQLVELMAREKS